MSYILDALRRADAERDRGAVPHLHTQAAPMSPGDRDDEPPAARPWLWLAAGLALGLLAAVVWVLGFRTDAAVPTPTAQDPTAAPPALPGAAADGPSAGSTPEVPIASTAAAPSKVTPPPVAPPNAQLPPLAPSIVPRELPRSPAPALARPEPAAAPAAPAASSAAAASAPAAGKASSPSPSASAAAPPSNPAPRTAAAEAAPGADSPIRPFAELPEDVRRELPTLAFGGSMYSQNAASRMVIVNGQLLREGDKVSPAVTIEQIRTRSVVLRYKTYRYEMAF